VQASPVKTDEALAAEFVKAYHVLIAKLILSDALFTHLEREDRIFLEGLV
jgi:Arc/MetJ family transcription regulator